MIGSLNDFENFLDDISSFFSDDEMDLVNKKFKELRESILDRGNNQIRTLRKEAVNVEISPKMRTYIFKVKE